MMIILNNQPYWDESWCTVKFYNQRNIKSFFLESLYLKKLTLKTFEPSLKRVGKVLALSHHLVDPLTRH
jgi:hypothetical protein